MNKPLRALASASAVALGLLFLSSSAWAYPPEMTRDEILCRAASAVGFSYWWGGACWCASGCSANSGCGYGSCSGNCPSCTHSGGHGADCSGLVTKVWQVPDPIAVSTCGHGPYVAASYRSSTSYWDVISRDSLQPGDALASTTHVVVYQSGDPWGQLTVYEARGCSWGVVHSTRSFSSSYSAARRVNISSGCECSPGQTQTEGCGTCATHSRTCQSNCHWGGWGGCESHANCNPGESQTEGCGNCGSRSRSCDGSCNWSGWSECRNQGDCSPNDVQREGCGNCGTHSRSCDGACHWNGWSACENQGECAAGAVENKSCCDCGSQARSCSSDCHWNGWSACEGPDPNGGQDTCDTHEPGPCAPGKMHCQQGCLKCVRDYEPQPEKCDTIDNDCNGHVDDGNPTQFGDPRPPYAGEIDDSSYPLRLAPGESTVVWASFINDGTSEWKKGEVWLASEQAEESGKPSELYYEETWPAWDVAAVLDRDVPPGQSATLEFEIQAPLKARQSNIVETFRLMTSDGQLMRCPNPALSVSVAVSGRPMPHDANTGSSTPVSTSSDSDEGHWWDCALSRPMPASKGWLGGALGALGIIALRARRRRSWI